MLENLSSTTATFATLTYTDSELPDIAGDAWSANRPVVPTLSLNEHKNWLKRFRKATGTKVRYFVSGEYGEDKQRPHYHYALFGFPNCIYGRTRKDVVPCCGPCEMVRKTWGKGHIYLGELNQKTASYIAGYVTKKFRSENLWTKEKLKGRTPEFRRMSLKPGIGAIAIKKLVSTSVRSRLGKYVIKCLDAPAALQNGGSKLPLGRYLTRKWREALGRSPETPSVVMGHLIEKLRTVYQEGKAAAKLDGAPEAFCDARGIYIRQNRQKVRNSEARFKIYESKGKL